MGHQTYGHSNRTSAVPVGDVENRKIKHISEILCTMSILYTIMLLCTMVILSTMPMWCTMVISCCIAILCTMVSVRTVVDLGTTVGLFHHVELDSYATSCTC